ncbi:hypothetical protein OQ252_05140 [Acetobacter farinalis]|uniref:Copper resistance protein D domain-containing protein n=1 Tax=Acetobacter farinalis TaxID=1260984 RepID=A0ABT3Q686_9PROT|nr:hypothetical protein [Acetobacter farinalis]MCX2560787.1 hypothetical protein [Acetobacter farinalis]NHO29438.1 hypothetical protein [Acetobacter farinalis]
MPHSILWSAILALHLGSMMFWIGGIAYAALIMSRSLSLLDTTQRNSVQLQSLGRFFRVLMHVIPTGLITGWLMILHEGGFAHMPWTTNLMQLLGVIMAALSVRILTGPFQKARRALRPQPALFDSIRKQLLVILFLGLVSIIAAALGHPFV